jgi:hypothetical protein
MDTSSPPQAQRPGRPGQRLDWLDNISAKTSRDMEIFLARVAVEISAVGAQVFLDLYTDEPLTDGSASQTLQSAAEMARHQQEPPPGRRPFSRGDPLMGVELDLAR